MDSRFIRRENAGLLLIAIFKKCYGANEEGKEKDYMKHVEKTPETKLFGFDAKTYEKNSIKVIMQKALDDKKHLFKGLKGTSLNGKKLKELKDRYNQSINTHQAAVEIEKPYLSAYLSFLDVNSLDDLRTCYEEEYPDFIVPDKIKPLKENFKIKEEPLLSKFSNTNWYLYFRSNNQLRRLILKIGKPITNKHGDYHVDLINLGYPRLDYKGHINQKQSNRSILTCLLQQDDSKHRELRFATEPQRQIKDLFMGTYSYYTSTGVIGTSVVLIHKIPIEIDNPTTNEFPIGATIKPNEVPDAIWKYFSSKEQTMIVPQGIYSIVDLEQKLVNRNDKLKTSSPTKYDLYISTPITYLQEEENEQLRNDIHQLIQSNAFKSLGLSTIADWNMPPPKFLSNKFRLKQEIEKMENSRLLMFICPQDRPISTSIIFLIGYAVRLEKPLLIIAKDLQKIAKLVRVVDHLDDKIILTELGDVIHSYEDIPAWIRVNEYHLL